MRSELGLLIRDSAVGLLSYSFSRGLSIFPSLCWMWSHGEVLAELSCGRFRLSVGAAGSLQNRGSVFSHPLMEAVGLGALSLAAILFSSSLIICWVALIRVSILLGSCGLLWNCSWRYRSPDWLADPGSGELTTHSLHPNDLALGNQKK